VSPDTTGRLRPVDAPNVPYERPQQAGPSSLLAYRSAGRRAFFLTLSVTQRDPCRRDRRGATGLDVVLGEVPVDAAGEQRGHGGKISADQARALCGMSGHCRYQAGMHIHAAHLASGVL
jgi:hypothetical protein